MDYDERVDVFSYGMVLCELVSREQPSMSVFERVIPGFGLNNEEIEERANEGCPQGLLKVTMECVADEPDERPSLAKVIADLKDVYPETASGKAYDDGLADPAKLAAAATASGGGGGSGGGASGAAGSESDEGESAGTLENQATTTARLKSGSSGNMAGAHISLLELLTLGNQKVRTARAASCV